MSTLSKNEQGQFTCSVYGEKVGFISKLFGCRHDELSRPFRRENTSFRTCLKCGASTPFDEITFETTRVFYYPPIVKKILDF